MRGERGREGRARAPACVGGLLKKKAGAPSGQISLAPAPPTHGTQPRRPPSRSERGEAGRASKVGGRRGRGRGVPRRKPRLAAWGSRARTGARPPPPPRTRPGAAKAAPPTRVGWGQASPGHGGQGGWVGLPAGLAPGGRSGVKTALPNTTASLRGQCLLAPLSRGAAPPAERRPPPRVAGSPPSGPWPGPHWSVRVTLAAQAARGGKGRAGESQQTHLGKKISGVKKAGAHSLLPSPAALLPFCSLSLRHPHQTAHKKHTGAPVYTPTPTTTRQTHHAQAHTHSLTH